MVHIVVQTLSAFCLGKAERLAQVFSNGTSRWQTVILDLIVGITNGDNNIAPLLISACIFPENKTAEKQIDGIKEKVQ